MPDYADLRRHLNQRVRLHFIDGEVIDALLVGVDPEQDGELTYEILSRLAPSATGRVESPPGTTCLALLAELGDWK